MKKHYLLTLAVLLLVFALSACEISEEVPQVVNETIEKVEQSIEETTEKATVEKVNTPKEKPELVAEEIFEVVSMPLYMEGTLTENDTTIDAYLYLTEQHLRAEMHDYDFVPIAVFNLVDDSAFFYCQSKKLGIAYDEFEIYEFLHYQDIIDDNAEFVENMQHDTMNGYDVVYGEVEYEGDVMKFWYSCEYDVPIKIELTTVEGNYSAMNVTKVEKLVDADPSLFDKPKTVMFIYIEDEDLDVEDVIEYLE